jgi:hypothetical protein
MVTTVLLSRWTAEGKNTVREILDHLKALSCRLTSGGIRRINVRSEHVEALGRELDRIAAPVLRQLGLLGPAPRPALVRQTPRARLVR